MKFGDFLKQLRQARYRSAREFCLKEGIGVSYPQYSRYESGEQLPPLATAIQIALRLQADLPLVLKYWCMEELRESTDVSSEVFAALSGAFPASGQVASGVGAAPLAERVSLDDVIVFNRQHLRLFQTDPRYRDVFTYVNSFALGSEGIALEELTQAMGISRQEVDVLTQRLDDLGILTLLPGGRVRSTKKNFYFPDDEEFFSLRNQNLLHNMQEILGTLDHSDLTARRGLRALVTRELTEEQFGRIMTTLEEALSEMVGMEEDSASAAIYSLAVLFGKRFERPQVQVHSQGDQEPASLPGLVQNLGIEVENASETSSS